MSNLRESLSERNIDSYMPSSSRISGLTVSPPMNSIYNANRDSENPNSVSPEHAAAGRLPQQQLEMNTDAVLNEVVIEFENLNTSGETTTPDVDRGKTRRKKIRKRPKQKQLHLQMPQVKMPLLQQSEGATSASTPNRLVDSAQKNIPMLQQPEIIPTVSTPMQSGESAQNQISVQELFMQQISSLYSNTNFRYLENLSHHPQYQHNNIHNLHNLLLQKSQNSVSVPNTPQQPLNMTPPYSNPNSPLYQYTPSTPKYVQNMLQHPLLSRSVDYTFQQYHISNIPQEQISQSNLNTPSPQPASKKSSQRSKNKKKQNVSMKFESYLSWEEVEEGLKSNNLFESVIRINPKQFTSAYVSNVQDINKQDILIEGIKHRNRALEGDLVVVQLIEKGDNEEENNEDNQKRGKVVYIKEKVHNRKCIGNLKLMPDKNRDRALFIPRDNRVPRLNIPFNTWPDNFYQDAELYENTLFLAKIIDWFDTRFAIGMIEQNIGQCGELITETKAILAQTDVDVTPFGSDVKHLYPSLDYIIPEQEIEKREDCRKLCLFSIDPFNCRDIDDCVSCKKLANGNYEIGVHISDVAHFLTENTILDKKVADKATTVYLVERAYHMLPDDLCSLCSLFPGEDKLAFSVFWEITADAQVLNHRFSKSVIHSCAKLAYEDAQAVLEDRNNCEAEFPDICNGFKYTDVYESIKILWNIAAIFRRKRFEGGALRIDQPKVSFHLDPTNGLPDKFWIYEIKESHKLIEEFMLLANMTVAHRIYEDHPKLAFLRSHPPPNGYMMQQLAKTLKPMGIELDISTAGSLHRTLLPYVGPDNEDLGRAMVLNLLCAKPMTRAKYFCAANCAADEFDHYALNVPLYTHFTSPIRRYADIMVHRLLSASLKFTETPNWKIDDVCGIAAQCNKQKYNAKKASELSTEVYLAKYIEMNSPVITEAVVVDVKNKYIDVIVIAMGMNRRIYFNKDFPGEYKCVENEAGARLSRMELTWHATSDLPEAQLVIDVFSIVKIEMHKCDEIVKIETSIMRPV